MTTLLPVFTFLSLALLSVTLFLVMRTRSGTKERLEKRLHSLAQPDRQEAQGILQEEQTYSDIPLLNRLFVRARHAADFARLVKQAGLSMRPAVVLLTMGLLGTIAALIALLWKGSVLGAGATFVAAGPSLGLWYLRRLRRGRRQAITRQLPDTLAMLRGALQAGYSLPQALEATSEEVPEPIRTELRFVTEELRLGHAMRGAFLGFYERTGIEDLRYFVVAVLINREIGGNLSDILEVVGNTIRERFKIQAQVRAITSQGRFSALILSALTPTLLLALTLLNPEYLQPMYHTRTGQMALAYAGASTAFGYWLMRRIVDIKIVRTD